MNVSQMVCYLILDSDINAINSKTFIDSSSRNLDNTVAIDDDTVAIDDNTVNSKDGMYYFFYVNFS